MANELDELMDKDPTSLSDQDIDKIIALHRQARANYEAGVKPKKGTDASGQEVKVDLVQLGLMPAAPKIRRI